MTISRWYAHQPSAGRSLHPKLGRPGYVMKGYGAQAMYQLRSKPPVSVQCVVLEDMPAPESGEIRLCDERVCLDCE